MKTTITTIQDVLNNSEDLFFFDTYYDRPEYENKLFHRSVLKIRKLPSELREEINNYVKPDEEDTHSVLLWLMNNNVDNFRFQTANSNFMTTVRSLQAPVGHV